MTFYYVNSITNETSWTPPSPKLPEKNRLRSYSNATYDSNRESIISDSSDVHPFVAELSGTQTPERNMSIHDSSPAEAAALQLQEALSSTSALTINELVSDTRAAIASIWEYTPIADDLVERVGNAVTAIRKLLYKAGTLPSSGKMQEILAERDESAQSRVKITQRKLVTTLSKVVLAARAITLNPASGIGRVQQDASDLDECVVNFAQEIERRELVDIANQRLTGLLVSAEGAAGVGTGLVGAGIGGGWKGFGFVPTTENAPQRVLSSSLITEFQDQDAILREKAELLSSAYAAVDPTGGEGDFTIYHFTAIQSNASISSENKSRFSITVVHICERTCGHKHSATS
jgi:son of sevenless-like protein